MIVGDLQRMIKEIKLSMGNNLQDLCRLVSEVELFMHAQSLSSRTRYSVNLVLEEILTNIVKYAYDDECSHEIEVEMSVSNSDVVVVIRCEDDGREFNPLSAPPPGIEDSIHQCDEGGLGIHLVRQAAHSMEYCRSKHKNVLTMSIKRVKEIAPGQRPFF